MIPINHRWSIDIDIVAHQQDLRGINQPTSGYPPRPYVYYPPTFSTLLQPTNPRLPVRTTPESPSPFPLRLFSSRLEHFGRTQYLVWNNSSQIHTVTNWSIPNFKPMISRVLHSTYVPLVWRFEVKVHFINLKDSRRISASTCDSEFAFRVRKSRQQWHTVSFTKLCAGR